MSLNTSSVRRAAIRVGMWATFSVTACGVTEHPHDTPAIDTSNDFGPSTPAAPGVTETAPPVDGANPNEAPTAGAGVAEAPGDLPLAPAAEPTGTPPAAPTLSGTSITLGGI